jgi:hypothetical protein
MFKASEKKCSQCLFAWGGHNVAAYHAYPGDQVVEVNRMERMKDDELGYLKFHHAVMRRSFAA